MQFLPPLIGPLKGSIRTITDWTASSCLQEIGSTTKNMFCVFPIVSMMAYELLPAKPEFVCQKPYTALQSLSNLSNLMANPYQTPFSKPSLLPYRYVLRQRLAQLRCRCYHRCFYSRYWFLFGLNSAPWSRRTKIAEQHCFYKPSGALSTRQGPETNLELRSL